DGAHGALLAIAGGSDLGLFEINEAATLVQESAHPEANIIFGTIIDDSLGDEVRVTVIAAGFDAGTPTHKKLDPEAFSSGSATSSVESDESAATTGGSAEQSTSAETTAHQDTGSATVSSRRSSEESAEQQQSGLPQSGTAGGYPVPHASQAQQPGQRSQGGLPSRAVPVSDESGDDDVDVPPFMRR